MQFVKDARDTSPTSLTRGILRTMSRWLWKAMLWTFVWEDQIRSRNLNSSMHLPIPTPRHAVPDQRPTRSPRPRSRLQPALTWRLESVIAGFDFEKREIHRDIIWTHPRTGSRWRNRVGKCQDELRQVNPLSFFIPSETSSSELQQVSAAAASDNPTGERLYLSMTEEGPSGEYKMTMQRDRHGRWMPTKGEKNNEN